MNKKKEDKYPARKYSTIPHFTSLPRCVYIKCSQRLLENPIVLIPSLKREKKGKSKRICNKTNTGKEKKQEILFICIYIYQRLLISFLFPFGSICTHQRTKWERQKKEEKKSKQQC